MTQTPVIELKNVTKQFGAVTALDGMSLALFPGEVHVLLGENGAGKSTLVNTLIGSYAPNAGRVYVRGEHMRHYTPAQAKHAGINVVLQDFSLAPTMTVTENLFLGSELSNRGLLSKNKMKQQAGERLAILDLNIDPDLEAGSLPRAEQQLVELVKALTGTPGVILLDEPTAAISESEANRLFRIVDKIRDEGWAVLYITHRMEEVRRLGDRVTVMRDGAHVSTRLLTEVTDSQLIRDMVGRDLAALYPPKSRENGSVLLRLDRVTAENRKVRAASLEVRAGEIVAIAGLVGSGKSEIAGLVMGLLSTSSGEYEICGRSVTQPEPRQMINAGIGFMPEERKRDALVLERSVEENITLEVVGDGKFSPRGLLRKRKLREHAQSITRELDIRPSDIRLQVDALSGGNQQKVVLARALTKTRRVFVVSEPTSGVDVGSRTEIYANLRRLCEAGAGVLMISSDLEEVVGMADRVYVMNGGRITSELEGDGVTHENVVAGAFGHRAVS